MRTYVATKNLGKLREMQAIFAGSQLALQTFAAYADVPEGDRSYVENALLKARALRAQLRDAGIEAGVIADDSGLEVDAMDGRPGVLSARYAGLEATWAQRRAEILRELENVADEDRGARFVSVLAFLSPAGAEIVARGEVHGRIARCELGEGGFGYDPIFIFPPLQRSFAELDETVKNRVSHRFHAAKTLLSELAES